MFKVISIVSDYQRGSRHKSEGVTMVGIVIVTAAKIAFITLDLALVILEWAFAAV